MNTEYVVLDLGYILTAQVTLSLFNIIPLALSFVFCHEAGLVRGRQAQRALRRKGEQM